MLEKYSENPESVHNDNIRARTAYETDLAWREHSKRAGRIVPLNGRLKAIIQTAVNLDPHLTTRGNAIDGKPQPSFQESLEATDRRLAFLNSYLPSLPPAILGVICGGSMSYGRFYNVREGYPDSSDLDLIFITDGAPGVNDVDQLVRPDLGFQEQEKALFRKRVPIFQKNFHDGNMEVLSHKFKLPEQEFDVSTHFIPKTVLTQIMDSKLRADLAKKTDTDVRLRDYKPGSFPHRINYQRDFEGNIYPLDVSEEEVALGTISMIPAYGIFNEQFVPGMYHNLCSPMFEVALDREDITTLMDQFQTIMYAYRDMALQRNSEAALSKSHIRRGVLSSFIINEIDQK